MKYCFKICLILLCLFAHQTFSQEKNDYFKLQDCTINVPILAVKGNIGLVFLSLYTSAWTLGYTGHQYFVNDKVFYSSKQLKPYFLQLNDDIANENFRIFENSKTTAKICGGVGFGLYLVGITSVLSQIYSVGLQNSRSQNNKVILGLLAVGGGLILSAPLIKLRGISKLKIAINRHNSFRKF